jgi:ribosomal protein L22
MYSLNEINKKMIQEEIKSNLILDSLNEALNTGNLQIFASAIDKLDNIAKTSLPTFKSLQTAIQLAEKEVNAYAVDPKKSEQILPKVITFYSKIWNFLSRDLQVLAKLPALRDFFDDTKTQDQNATLAQSPDAENVKRQLIAAIKNDESPWYKKAIASLTKNPQIISSIPYLNINMFIQEFMMTPKQNLKTALESASGAVKQAPAPEVATKNIIPTTLQGQGSPQSQPTPEAESAYKEALDGLTKLYTTLETKFQIKGAEGDKLLKQIILDGFMNKKSIKEIEDSLQKAQSLTSKP